MLSGTRNEGGWRASRGKSVSESFLASSSAILVTHVAHAATPTDIAGETLRSCASATIASVVVSRGGHHHEGLARVGSLRGERWRILIGDDDDDSR